MNYDDTPFVQQQSSIDYSKNDEFNYSLTEHITYVKTKYIQQPLFSFEKISPQTHPNHSDYYFFNVEANLPFRLDTIRIENLYDSSKEDCFRRCFLEPIAEDNQFQGWTEGRLLNHPLIQCIQELTTYFNPQIIYRIWISWAILLAVEVFNILALVAFAQGHGNGFAKFLGCLIATGAIVTFLLMALQIARILRGFGTIKKLSVQFLLTLLIQIIYIPLLSVVNTHALWIPFVLIILECFLFWLFVTQNKAYIIANQQLFILINGKSKKLY